jgi:formate dehydrogenase accessory protein FdhD
VYLNDRTANLAQHEVETVPTCCTTNRTFNGYFRRGEELAKVEPVAWDLDLLFEVARDFAADTEQHRATNGTHSCRLANADGVRICCEDIGRHNALDKAIGAALIDGVDLRGCLAYTSGRVPVDMVLKAVRAGLPVLASKTVATDRAIELACAYDLTLLTRATPRAVDVLNDPWNERIEAVSHIALGREGRGAPPGGSPQMGAPRCQKSPLWESTGQPLSKRAFVGSEGVPTKGKIDTAYAAGPHLSMAPQLHTVMYLR